MGNLARKVLNAVCPRPLPLNKREHRLCPGLFRHVEAFPYATCAAPFIPGDTEVLKHAGHPLESAFEEPNRVRRAEWPAQSRRSDTLWNIAAACARLRLTRPLA